jgi:8-oxoguanine deaminase
MRRLLTNIDALQDGIADAPLRDAHVVVDGERIAAIGAGAAPAGDFDEVIDLSGCIVLPGFVNAHHHFFQTLTRAIPGVQRGHLLDWLMLLYPLWARMTPDDLAAATEAACAELLLTGATTSSDHCYLVPGARPEFVEAEVAAARGMGLRLHLVRGSITRIEADLGERLTALLGPRAGGLLDESEPVLAEMARAIRAHHAPGDGAWVTVGLGPTAIAFDDPAFMRRVAAMAAEAGCSLHTHFHPRPDEREYCAAQFGKEPVEVLADLGWLRPGTYFAHATRMDAATIARVARRGGRRRSLPAHGAAPRGQGHAGACDARGGHPGGRRRGRRGEQRCGLDAGRDAAGAAAASRRRWRRRSAA